MTERICNDCNYKLEYPDYCLKFFGPSETEHMKTVLAYNKCDLYKKYYGVCKKCNQIIGTFVINKDGNKTFLSCPECVEKVKESIQNPEEQDFTINLGG